MWLGHEQRYEAFDGSEDSARTPVPPGKRTLTARLPPRSSATEDVAAANEPSRSSIANATSASAPGPVIYRKALSSHPAVDPFDFRFTDATTAHRADAGGGSAPEQVTALAQSGGAPLSESLRALFEPRFGQDFGDVRVHTGDEAATAARSIDARAYTLGSSIVFGAGQYQPDSRDGQHLLAHELTHVVQQRGSVQRAVYRAGGEASATTATSTGPAAQLAQAAEQLESLHELAATLFAEQPEHAAAIAGMAAGLAQLRAVIASGDRGAQERALALLARKLPPGLVPGLESTGPQVSELAPADPEAPSIVEQRSPEIARAGFTVSQVSDPAEQEAERVADAVMSGAHAQVGAFGGGAVQRAGGKEGTGGGGDGGGDNLLELLVYFACALLVAFFLYLWLAKGGSGNGASNGKGSAKGITQQIKKAQETRAAKEKEDKEREDKRREDKERALQEKEQEAQKREAQEKAKKQPTAKRGQKHKGKTVVLPPEKPKADESGALESGQPASQAAPSGVPSAKPDAPKPDAQKPEVPSSGAQTASDVSSQPQQPDASKVPEAAAKAPPKFEARKSQILIAVAEDEQDPVAAVEVLGVKEDDTFLDLTRLMSTHPCARVAAVFQICERKLSRTKEVLDAVAPFPGTAVIEFLDHERASPLALEFLRGIRSDLTKATFKEWWRNFARWSSKTREELAKDLSAEDEALDEELLVKFGGEATRWASQLQVEVGIATEWIQLTESKGGLEARRFITAHLTKRPDNRNELYLFLETQQGPKSSSALSIAYQKHREARGGAAIAPPQGAAGPATGLANNGTDCFLISVCQLLALPAYDAVELLPRVRAVVNKVKQGTFVPAVEVRELRTYLHQLGLVEAVEHQHEDAAELLSRLLETSRGVRITQHHHIDQHDDGGDSDPRTRPAAANQANFNNHGDLTVTPAAEAMLQVPILEHGSLEEWLNGAHTDGATEELDPDPARPASYEWVNIGNQLRSVLSRTTRTDMHSLPTPLTIQLLRFDNRGRKVRKVFTMPRSFQVTELDLQTNTNTRRTYELRAVVYHQGNHGLGHYWMHRQDDQQGWLTAEDGNVRQARQALAPKERDLEHDIDRGYLYTYVQTASAPVGPWAASTSVAFDRGALPPPAALGGAAQGLGKKSKSKDADEGADASPSASAESDKVRAQLWYGIGALKQNAKAPESADIATRPQDGLINEGPCEQITQELVNGMTAVGLTDSKMVGAVKTLSGAWYVTCSGRPDPRFSQVVDHAAGATGLPLTFVRKKNNIAPVHSSGPHKKDPKYILGEDISTFDGSAADPGQYWNAPKMDKNGEVAGGAPGTCALPKLVDYLIDQQDPPVHASEKWFSSKGTKAEVMIGEGQKAHSHHSGETVPSCKTCRSIVAQQLRGVGSVILEFLSEEKERKAEIARRAAVYAQNMHLYTELLMRQLPAFSKELSEVNPEYFDSQTYTDYKKWYRSIVETMIAERIEELLDAEDPRYRDADLDAEKVDLDLQDHLGAQVAAPELDEDQLDEEDAPEIEAPKSADDRERANKLKKKEEARKKKQSKKSANHAKAKTKGNKKPVVVEELDDEWVEEDAPVPIVKPAKPKRELSAADEIFVGILNQLQPVNAHWLQIPERAWTGSQPEQGIEFEMAADSSSKKREEMDLASEEMGEIRDAMAAISVRLSRDE